MLPQKIHKEYHHTGKQKSPGQFSLSFVGLKLASDARLGEIESQHSGLEKEVQELREELTAETQKAEHRLRAETRAEQFYQLIRQQKRREVVEGYEELQAEQFSPAEAAFFRDTVDRFRLDLSVDAYQSGLDLMRTGRYAEAAESFGFKRTTSR